MTEKTIKSELVRSGVDFKMVYEDAKKVGISVSFDENFRVEAKIEQCSYTGDKILKEHGANCCTYKCAAAFIENWSELVCSHSDGVNTQRVEESKIRQFDQLADTLEAKFISEIGKCYGEILTIKI